MPDISYEAIELGREFGPWEYPLVQRIARHLEAPGNAHPWHREWSPWGPPAAPPTILGNATLRLIESMAPVPPGTMHTKQAFEFVSALRLDRQIIGYGRFVEKYERRGRRWFVFEARFRDETGLVLGRSRVTMAFPERVETVDEPREPRALRLRRGELAPIVRTLTQERLTAYSEDSYNALRGKSTHIHTQAAKSAGFEGTLANGLLSVEYMSEMMMGVFEQGWITGGQLSVAFIRPALCGDTLAANAWLVERIGEGTALRTVYEVWCENQRGEVVTVGTASGLLAARDGR